MYQMFDYYAAQLHQGTSTMANTIRALQTSSLTMSETEKSTYINPLSANSRLLPPARS